MTFLAKQFWTRRSFTISFFGIDIMGIIQVVTSADYQSRRGVDKTAATRLRWGTKDEKSSI